MNVSILDAMVQAGLKPELSEPIFDGKIHRFRDLMHDRPGKLNGWYVLHDGGDFIAGVFGHWKIDLKETFCSRDIKHLTTIEKSAYHAKMSEICTTAEEETKRSRAESRKRSADIWNIAKPAPYDHPYLVTKGIKPFGCKIFYDKLVIPVRINNVLTGLQFISTNGEKKFKTGTEITGGYCFIGTPNENTILICEGFATGASCHEASGHAVAVAFTAGNLIVVAKALRKEYPKHKLIICADDDHTTECNPGISKAMEAANAVLGSLAIPAFPDTASRKDSETDFNDLSRHGLNLVRQLIVEAAQPPHRININNANTQKPTLKDFNKITMEVHREILRVLTDPDCKGPARNRKIARVAVSALTKVGKLFHHSERRDFDSAMFFDLHRKCLLRIRSDAFGSWLSEWLGINRADVLYKFTFAEIETAALSKNKSTPILPEAYWASRPGAIYLSNGDGHIVKITADGVLLVDNGTDDVLFTAGRTLVPWKLTAPHDAFETCRLFRRTHCSAAHGRPLLRLWFYSLPSNPSCKPPLCLPGPVGSGKTRTIKGFAELLGIPFIAHKVEEKNEDDFWPACDAGGIFTLDNADTRCRWLADALANAATGGCSQRRKLYTNSETVILRSRAWLAVTTANPTFAADAGLADRLIVVRMDRQGDEDTGDEELGMEILAARDAGLSHLVQTLSSVLADNAPVPRGLNRRHPDFAAFAVKIGRALGREQEALLALKNAEQDKAALCLENDFFVSALIAYLDSAGSFTGTSAELCQKLIETDGELIGKLTPKRLSRRLTTLWPHLKTALGTAEREENRKGFAVFCFKTKADADFADIEMPISINSQITSPVNVLVKDRFEVGNVGNNGFPTPEKCLGCERSPGCMLVRDTRSLCEGPFAS